RREEPPDTDADRWCGADEDVSDDPAAQASHPREHHHTDEVETLPDRDKTAGECEDEYAEDVQHQLEVVGRDHHGPPKVTLQGVGGRRRARLLRSGASL